MLNSPAGHSSMPEVAGLPGDGSEDTTRVKWRAELTKAEPAAHKSMDHYEHWGIPRRNFAIEPANEILSRSCHDSRRGATNRPVGQSGEY
jgi:hypothetical protein